MNAFGIFYIFFYCCLQLSQSQTDFDRASQEAEDKHGLIQNGTEKFPGEGVAESAINNVDNGKFKIEIFPSNSSFPGRRRKPRKLFSKIHSAASFLAGLKLGSVLSKNGFELGHGQISSSHNFQLFGKTVNSATSLSYGNINHFVPTVNDEVAADGEALGDPKRNSLKRDVFHVTVIENPSDRVVEKLEEVITADMKEKLEEGDEVGQKKGEPEKNREVVRDDEEREREEFLREHNDRVKRFNEDILKRTNSKH